MAARIALSLVLACSLLPATAAASWPLPQQPAGTATAAAAHEWYYAADGRTQGPLDDVGVSAAYLAGRIDDTTLIWRGGQTWVPLAQVEAFIAIDRWYVRHGSKELGPMTGAQLRSKLADGRANGHAVDRLEVRMELTYWVPVAGAMPLIAAAPHDATKPSPTGAAAPPVATSVPAPTPTASSIREAADTSTDEVARANRMRKGGLITLTVGAGLVVIGGGIAGGYSTGAVGTKALWAGVALACVGLVPTIVGAAVFGAGNSRLRKATRAGKVARLRLGASATRGHGGLVLTGRF